MSYASYDKDDRHDRSDRKRDSRRSRPPIYQEEEIIETRRGPPRSPRQDLIRRQDSDDVEEVQRDFPPPGEGAYVKRRSTYRDPNPPRRARSDGRRDRDSDYYGGGGRRSRGHDDRRGNRRRDYSSESSSESPPRNRRRKSMGEQALAALGLGGAAAALTGGDKSRSKDHDRRSGGGGSDRRRRRSYDSESSRSRSRTRGGGDNQREKIQQAVKAAVIAGATEAFRSRKEPGGWGGDKGKRVLTAAIGAGGIDGLVSGKDPDKKSGRHTIEAVIGGLAGNRIINGARDKSGSRSRSRSRSRARSRGGGGGGVKTGLEGLAAGGIAAAAGKALLDYRNRSKSRGRRSYSSSDDSRSPPRNKKRSKSVSDYVSQGMVAVGLKDKKDSRDDRGGGRRRGYDGYDDGYSQGPPQQGRLRGGGGNGGDGVKNSSSNSSDSEDISSSEEDRRRKKMRGKELITAGLASIATIHAAHSVYQSVEARNKRHKEVLEGTMTPQEASRKKNKARLQDVASVGIAALGIKGAVSEWKEMKEQRKECLEFDDKRAERHEKRLHKSQESSAYGSSNGDYRNSAPNLYPAGGYPAPYPGNVYQGGYYPDAGPRYQDGNPYHVGGVPPPPMGPQQARY